MLALLSATPIQFIAEILQVAVQLPAWWIILPLEQCVQVCKCGKISAHTTVSLNIRCTSRFQLSNATCPNNTHASDVLYAVYHYQQYITEYFIHPFYRKLQRQLAHRKLIKAVNNKLPTKNKSPQCVELYSINQYIYECVSYSIHSTGTMLSLIHATVGFSNMSTFMMILLMTLVLQKSKSSTSSGSRVLRLQSVSTPSSSSITTRGRP